MPTEREYESEGNIMDKACNHIIGFEIGADSGWLVYESKQETFWKECADIIFNFCPLCGKKLIER